MRRGRQIPLLFLAAVVLGMLPSILWYNNNLPLLPKNSIFTITDAINVHHNHDIDIPRVSIEEVNSGIHDVHTLRSTHRQKNSRTSSITDGFSWIGNYWIPPPGYKLYSARQMLHIVQALPNIDNRGILFIGDSTSRRTYGALWGILKEAAKEEESSSNADSVHYIPPQHFDSVEIVGTKIDRTLCEARSSSDERLSICRTLASTVRPVSDKVPQQQQFIKMDYVAANCIHTVLNYTESIQFSQFILREYSIVVLAIGPWELLGRCGGIEGNETFANEDLLQRLRTMLDSLHHRLILPQQRRQWNAKNSHNVDDNLVVIVRTMGYDDEGKYRSKARDMNRVIMGYIDDQHVVLSSTNNATGDFQKFPFLYSDWGTVVDPRSIGRDRIASHNVVHYGWEARLASIQMIMNELNV
mmetsp:Transcript_12655/g.19031  ORF Transcript_12655/g.19031 Transcript_12655/m.19031 type:complete len:413 (-) Transcript_12655:441-1679(-)|eukprot:CAMPEP_0196818338 /NCGR_PEP_ID=MMETSP1362-20130617/65115_1 /TAXON_ID=163516 /ORGANISM="Leptocylindrus danicus, Strain CCMP1856" /LENGTH=412 /DNA_ID=CAMNT_0042196401 /DNA_START=70 /DNA_END=1308 /DNA_ORIENTATION=+